MGPATRDQTALARIVIGLARHIDSTKYVIECWFLAGPGPLFRELESAGVSTKVVLWAGPGDISGCFRFARALSRGCFALVHQHFGGRMVRWTARVITSAPVVLHLHSRLLENRSSHLATLRTSG